MFASSPAPRWGGGGDSSPPPPPGGARVNIPVYLFFFSLSLSSAAAHIDQLVGDLSFCICPFDVFLVPVYNTALLMCDVYCVAHVDHEVTSTVSFFIFNG